MNAPAKEVAGRWADIRFRYLADVRKGCLPSLENETRLDAESAPYLTMDYLREETSEPTLVTVNPSLLTAPADAILLLWDGSNAGEFLLAKPGVVSSTTALVTPKCIDPRFFFWACKEQEDRIRAETVGMGIPHVNGEFLANLRFRLPNPRQQRVIADYLDRETARLDALVAVKERVLGLLAQKRQALIALAITRGLNPLASRRDSGISWLGKIPAHWKVQRGATVFGERDERCEPKLPLLNVSLNTGVTVRIFSNDRIEAIAADLATMKVARKGDLVFNKMRFWQGAGGIAPEDGLVSPDYTVASVADELDPKFVELVVRHRVFNDEVRRYSYGLVDDRLRLYWDSFKNIQFPIPPRREQRAIVRSVKHETQRIENLSDALQHSIALLKERREALIATAVTGQIDTEQAA